MSVIKWSPCFERLNQAIQNFFQTHVVSLELGGARKMARGGGGDEGFGGFGGGGGFNKKAIKKEQKYVNYAFMVLLGIFGLTGPLVMKVLALMAAKAILAAKAALIIVGSVALKKLFEKDHPSEPAIKVHTINHDHEDDHDRIGKYGYTGYGLESDNPYASYYDDYYNKNFASSSHKRR
ncbi:hypothetical protein ABEB36_013166 [Hypothenemus hampei]|uniref:Uncharacterized protein n=1 Tax=Hypothenemus hampei TaxID=57062 RepID=A0ABD1E733_HYPHA